MIQLRGYQGTLRQIAIMDLGHDNPTLLITNEPLAKPLNWRSLRSFLRRFILFRVGFARGSNQMKTAPSKLIDRYARRMIIENTIADAIEFFHLDALSSAVPLKIEVDLQLTLMAGTLYRILARRVGLGMETAKPQTLFRKFIRNRARIDIHDQEIVATLTRRSNNPYLLTAGYDTLTQVIPWLKNKPLKIRFQ